MNALSSNNIVFAWETGQGKHVADRALLLLSLAIPSLSMEELRQLTIGQRNRYLLTVRKETLGTQAQCLATCPYCSEKLEFPLDIGALLKSVPATLASDNLFTLTIDAFTLHFRLPTSADLIIATNSGDQDQAHALVFGRCLQHAEHAGEIVTATDLPEGVIVATAEAMSEADPLAQIPLALSCSTCEQSWTSYFDIAGFFWTEVEAQARRLLYEVHTIASAYGWHEAAILALSTHRRHYYLELIRS